MTFLELKPLTADLLPAAVELDRQCLGGIWSLDGYQREIDSPNSDLLALSIHGMGNGEQRTGNGEEEKEDSIQNPKSKIQNPKSLIGLGCLWAIVEEAHITLLAIHPDYQRQGLGLMLLCTLLQSAQYRGLERATLEVRASNQAAIALYQKFGFQEAGRRRRYYQDTGEDALVLWRSKIQSTEFTQLIARWKQRARNRFRQVGWHFLDNDGLEHDSQAGELC